MSVAIQNTQISEKEFNKTVRKRVNQYFKENGIDIHGGMTMKVKLVVMTAIYIVPFLFILSGAVSSLWLALILSIVMGLGMSFIGLAVMHDANHDAFSKSRRLNKFVGQIIFMIGGSAINWKIQHNVLHHSYTNVDGMDEDIDPGNIMRFSPYQEVKWMHRFQFLYAWFLYSLMTLSWATVKDFKQLYRYEKKGLVQGQRTTYAKEVIRLVIAKAAYFIVFIGLPIVLTDFTWYQVLVGFTAMHLTCGLALACIFQPAHVMETSEFAPKSEATEKLREGAAYQLKTTTNFGMESGWFTWFVGGLNFQIEHHLFPNISHVHYPKISSIVRDTAREFGLPYNEHTTFVQALVAHGSMLRKLGRA